MSTRKLNSVTISQFESFLELCLCKFVKSEKGHVKYSRSDLFRPIIFQNHIQPIPEFIILNNLRVLSLTKKDFFDILDGAKIVVKNDSGSYNLQVVKNK